MRRSILYLVLLGAAFGAAAQKLPAEFDHDRIRLAVPAPDGSTLKFYTDSGGGWNTITRAAAERLRLPQAGEWRDDDDKETLPLVAFPAFMVKAGVPAPSVDAYFHGQLVETAAPRLEYDGVLGSRWFAGHVWRIDYASHEVLADSDEKPAQGSHKIALGFQTADDGKRLRDMPRLVVTVEGRDIDMLLDTGAETRLTDASAPVLRAPAGSFIGASFIVKSILDDWHAKHPEWRFIADGDDTLGRPAPMIEVPHVTVAGFTVGPVWFAQKPDANFSEMMSSMMDKPVQGSFGGSGLRYFRVVLDYQKAMAWFEPTAASN